MFATSTADNGVSQKIFNMMLNKRLSNTDIARSWKQLVWTDESVVAKNRSNKWFIFGLGSWAQCQCLSHSCSQATSMIRKGEPWV